MKRYATFILFVLVIAIGYFFLLKSKSDGQHSTIKSETKNSVSLTPPPVSLNNPLAISTLKQKTYPGSNLTFETTLPPGENFNRYIVSYQSDGLKQYGLLTVPTGQKPLNGWPIILFNHGYIPPSQYSTENSYASFVNSFAAAGYIVLKPDYRGNGASEGSPVQIYVSSDYLTDSMNALSSIKKYKDSNPQKIGVFGHSMGGNITLHELVIFPDIKAAEIMAGVVGDEKGIINWWEQRIAAKSITGNDLDTYSLLQQMIADYGNPDSNPRYWDSIDPTKYITDISAPVQIQVGTSDIAVPVYFSSFLKNELQKAGKTVKYREYPGADHNLSPDTATALTETVIFFNKHLK